MTAKRIKTKALPTPRSKQEAEQLLHEIGEAQREVARINTEMNDDIAEVKRGYEEEASPYNEAIEQKFAALHAWAEIHRDDLLKGKLKSANLTTGAIGWRVTPFKVGLSKIDQVIDSIKQLGFSQFLRNKEEVNKDAMLVDDDSRALAGSIKGVKISQSEEFFAKPFETQIERAETVKKAA